MALKADGGGSGPLQVMLGPYDVIVERHGVVQTLLFGSPPVHEQRVTFDRPE